MSVLEKLTEGIVHRNVKKEGQALLEKWEQTGLLEGISDEQRRNGMAVLLENQAKELLREASSMSAGDVEGFASVAFPIVRRVFGGLIANDLVSVQPMSLPSGLIFFLDFTFTDQRSNFDGNASIYGGNVVGRQLTGGVDLAIDRAAAACAAGHLPRRTAAQRALRRQPALRLAHHDAARRSFERLAARQLLESHWVAISGWTGFYAPYRFVIVREIYCGNMTKWMSFKNQTFDLR